MGSAFLKSAWKTLCQSIQILFLFQFNLKSTFPTAIFYLIHAALVQNFSFMEKCELVTYSFYIR